MDEIKLTLLALEDIVPGKDQLEIFKKYSNVAQSTDLVPLTGGEVEAEHEQTLFGIHYIIK